jgi:hypothetical protein
MNRADRRRLGERGPKKLLPEPIQPRPERPPPLSTWCQWRRKLIVLFLGLLMLFLCIGVGYVSTSRSDAKSAPAVNVQLVATPGIVPTLKSYELVFEAGQGSMPFRVELYAVAET